MRGTVRIDSDNLSIARIYNRKSERRLIINRIVRKHDLIDYTITIIPDDNETNGQDIEHHGSGIIHRAYCSPCVVL